MREAAPGDIAGAAGIGRARLGDPQWKKPGGL